MFGYAASLFALSELAQIGDIFVIGAYAAASIVVFTLFVPSVSSLFVLWLAVSTFVTSYFVRAETDTTVNFELGLLSMVIGFSASTALFLPISTPPNAVAFSTGYLRQSDFRYLGLLIGTLGPVLIVIFARMILSVPFL